MKVTEADNNFIRTQTIFESNCVQVYQIKLNNKKYEDV